MSFKNAVLFSILIHIMILNPLRNNISLKRYVEEKKPIIVDYVIIKEPKRLEVINKITESKMIETPRVELKSDAQLRSAAAQEDARRPESPKKNFQDIAKKESKIKSSKDYISYYQLIREKIRRGLKENYRDYSSEGNVHLIFTLGSDGTLLKYDIEYAKSTGDKNLLDIVIVSLKQASPFPAFPKGLTAPQMSFDLTILFKKK